MEAAPTPDGAPEPAPAKSELPTVASPPLSPGAEIPALAAETPAPAIEPTAVVPIVEPAAGKAPAAQPRWVLKPRHKRYALLAATVALAAGLGAVVGALASGGFSAPVRPNVAAIEENKAMVQSIARLAKEITTLKAGLEQANKSAHSQIARISERLDHAGAEITGSIAAPQTTAPQDATPLPMPRPAPRVVAVETEPPARPPIVPGWTIRDTRGGHVYVENHGEVFQVMVGAPLPGLGPVQSIRRQDGRWLVQTPKGIIVSMRDRRYFEDF
jgi:hypothetical protein